MKRNPTKNLCYQLKKQTCIYNKTYGKISFIRNRNKIKMDFPIQ